MVAIAVAALTLTASVNVGSISIVAGWFPVFLFWVTVAVCLLAVVLRRDVLKEFAIGIPIGAVFAVLLFTVASPHRRRSRPARPDPSTYG